MNWLDLIDGTPEPGLAVVQRLEPDGSRAWWSFREPELVLRAEEAVDVPEVLAEVERQTLAGKTAVGFLCYEAASGLDPVLETLGKGRLPLAGFAIYRSGERMPSPGLASPEMPPSELRWVPTMDASSHRRAVERIRDWISQGETYQVNLTYRLQATFRENPWAIFSRLVVSQSALHCAYLDLGDDVLASVSPELFFRLEGRCLVTRPMKGTAPRGRTTEEDSIRSAELQRSEKERAENLMIVDMLRNDLGKIARPGSVRVDKLYAIERYPSVLQMTSTVSAESGESLTAILRALFPSASITGAPKVRAMQLIAEVEGRRRGIYTGAIGVVGPGRRAEMNVAIRTLHLDRERGMAEYGTGGGIVWDSDAAAEHEETLTKALVLTHGEPRPTLLETLVWYPGRGYQLVDRHLRRMVDSAAYFDIPVEVREVEKALARLANGFGEDPLVVRLLIAGDGKIEIEVRTLDETKAPWIVALASSPVDSSNALLFHKTTRRQVYRDALASAQGVDDVVMWNEHGEVTELTVGNLVAEIGGLKKTPPLACGLLPGTMRAELLERGEIVEEKLRVAEIREILEGSSCERLWLVNSVRGWVEVVGKLPLEARGN